VKFGTEQPVIDFLRYPAIGDEDGRYNFGAARVRAMETRLLGRNILIEMAQADDFGKACEILASSSYNEISQKKSPAAVEGVLEEKRLAVNEVIEHCCYEPKLIEVLKSNSDFINIRLATRRIVTERNLGDGYNNFGNVHAEQFKLSLEQKIYALWPEFMQETLEQAILAYYNTKDIIQIDNVIDQLEAEYRIKTALELNLPYLLGLFRTQIDLVNIRTLLRLKWAGIEDKPAFLPGGYVEQGRFLRAMADDYDGIRATFYTLPYYETINVGVNYLTSQDSFIGLEKMCDDHIIGYAKEASRITSGTQPIIAYILKKQMEIKMVRMVLAGKRNQIEAAVLLERLAEEI
jgi:V/A-type H+-transporting ATPase subunit C